MFKINFRNAFTLAEVLTTLMVIGVVAAMTIPTLLNSTDDHNFRSSLKKAVSVLSQAIQLNIAKEKEGNITSSYTLCQFFANSLSGTCVEQTGTNITIMSTGDGMQYGFVYRGDGSGAYHDFATECGKKAVAANPDSWTGAGATCLVLVDVNGGKGTSGFSYAETFLNSDTSTQAVKDDYTIKKDQFALIANAAGVFPVISNANKLSGSRGYRYLFGESAATPWGSKFTISDTK